MSNLRENLSVDGHAITLSEDSKTLRIYMIDADTEASARNKAEALLDLSGLDYEQEFKLEYLVTANAVKSKATGKSPYIAVFKRGEGVHKNESQRNL